MKVFRTFYSAAVSMPRWCNVSLDTCPLETAMRVTLIILTVLVSAACSSSVVSPDGIPEPSIAPSVASGCYVLQLGAKPSPDVQLPALIELSNDAAPGFVEPGRFAVGEPGSAARLAPISYWRPNETGELELSLGGGFTGYTFRLEAAGSGDWVGEGIYCADFGLLPAPPPLPARLIPTACP